MKVVILAGGFGTRLTEESDVKPKPMVEIGGKPIIWHIMKTYSHYGFNDFVILLGYKGYIIKEYFSNYFLHQSDITFDMLNNKMEVHENKSEPWRITLIDTGINTMTGGRIKRAQKYIGDETFMLTYGDGLADINIRSLLDFHKAHEKTMTMTAVQPGGRFGALNIQSDNRVCNFIEKPKGDGSWINGGYFVCEPAIFKYINGDETILEGEPLEKLASQDQIFAYKHSSFWCCMDTPRDKRELVRLWDSGSAPWVTWGLDVPELV